MLYLIYTEERQAGALNLIICVDNKNGIMFNGRRQSRDRAVCEDILDMTGEHLLYTSEYSFALFEKYADSRVICSDSPVFSAGRGDYCFAEDTGYVRSGGQGGHTCYILLEQSLSCRQIL